MIYIPNESTDPYYNQAFEQAVFDLCEKGDILLVWRNKDAIVCGRNQNIYAEVSISEAEESGVRIVRRDTGGGTVYHDEGNVNYTLISDSNGISIDYDEFLDRAVNALKSLGIPAHRNKACDIAINGMKISGNAQRQTKTRVLHHGTLLFDSDIGRLKHFSRDRSKGYVSKSIESARSEVTNIHEHISSLNSTQDFMEEFKNAMLASGETVKPTDEILCYADKLMKEKYRSWDWTYGRNPAFLRTASDDRLNLKYSAKRGVITEISLTLDSDVINADVFIGERLQCGSIHELCFELMSDAALADRLYKMIL